MTMTSKKPPTTTRTSDARELFNTAMSLADADADDKASDDRNNAERLPPMPEPARRSVSDAGRSILNESLRTPSPTHSPPATSTNTSTSTTTRTRRELPRPSACSECDAEDPKWYVPRLGVFCCSACAGVFRSLPVQTTGGVRSLTLDYFSPTETNDVAAAAESVGARNRAMEQGWRPGSVPKPVASSAAAARHAWIRAKYVDRAFASSSPSSHELEKGGESISPTRASAHSSEETTAADTSAAREMAGLLDVRVVGVRNVKRSHHRFDARQLSGGFRVEVRTGTSSASASLHFHTLEKNQAMHLNWDGRSDLVVTVTLGSGTLAPSPVARGVVSIRSALAHGAPLDASQSSFGVGAAASPTTRVESRLATCLLTSVGSYLPGLPDRDASNTAPLSAGELDLRLDYVDLSS